MSEPDDRVEQEIAEGATVGYVAAALHDATDGELWSELKSRYDAAIFSGVREVFGDPHAKQRLLLWHGCPVTVFGLSSIALGKIGNVCMTCDSV